MDGMIDYIFSTLKKSDKTLERIKRNLSAQSRLNIIVTVFAIITVVNLTTFVKRVNEQDEKMKKLDEKIEELSNKKGD